MLIPTIEHCTQGLERSHLLVDTNFLIEASRSLVADKDNSPYKELLEALASLEVTLVTIPPVAIEFYKGSDLLADRRKKKDFYDQIISATLPLDGSIVLLSERLVALYRGSGKDISVTDYYLGASLLKYKASQFLLLTKDHGDFPVKIYDRVQVVVLQRPKGGVDTYGLFKFSEEKASRIEQELAYIHSDSGAQ